MFSWLKYLLLACVISLAGCASSGGRNEPVENIETKLSGNYTLAQIRDSIREAGEGRRWIMNDKGNGVFEGIYVRQGHKAVVNITYNVNAYKISYVSSENLYERKDSQGNISVHYNYMRWIRNLDKDIQVFLSRKK